MSKEAKRASLPILAFVLAVLAWWQMAEVAASSWQGSSVQSGAAHDASIFPALSSAAAGVGPMQPLSAAGILYAVHVGSAADPGYIVFRDTVPFPGSTVVSSGAVLIQIEISTAGAAGTTAAGSGVASDRFIQFSPPLRLQRGLAVQGTGSCPRRGALAGSEGNWCYTVVYDSIE